MKDSVFRQIFRNSSSIAMLPLLSAVIGILAAIRIPKRMLHVHRKLLPWRRGRGWPDRPVVEEIEVLW
jgi:hypothetical protein